MDAEQKAQQAAATPQLPADYDQEVGGYEIELDDEDEGLLNKAWREVREAQQGQAGSPSVATYDGISEEEQEAILAEMAEEDAARG